VGLDVVRNNVHSLNGEIEIRSEAVAAHVGVKVPLTLNISQALFIRAGSSVLAMPLAVVERFRRLRPEEIEALAENCSRKGARRRHGSWCESMARWVCLPSSHQRLLVPWSLCVRGPASGRCGEEVLGKDEVVIKNLGQYFAPRKLFPGATVSPDGSLILLLT